MTMSSTKVMCCVCLRGVVMFRVLKSVDEITLPSGTPVSNWRYVDVVFLKVV